MKRLYLYLAKRSRQEIKLITVLQGENVVSSKITDLSKLSWPPLWEHKINKIIYDNRLLYEPWIESATSFEELRSRLFEKGFKDITSNPSPLLDLDAYAKAP